MTEFDWGADLGEQWFLDAGKSIGCDLRQIKFAAAKHRGCSNAESARQAGYSIGSDGSGAKSEGYRVARSNKVVALIQMANAESGMGPDGCVDGPERKRILSTLARNSDPLVRIRSIEQLEKIDQRENEARAAKGESSDPIMSLKDLAQTNPLAAYLVASKHGIAAVTIGVDTSKLHEEISTLALKLKSNGHVDATQPV